MPKLLLIVDDWELLERYEERFSNDFSVFCAPFGPEGIRMAREERPDLILLNLTFENMTNEEACQSLRADPQTTGIPIVSVGNGGPGPDHWIKEPVSARNIAKFLAKE